MGTIELITAAIQATILAAPKVMEAVRAAREWIAGLFQAGVIDAVTQNRLNAWADATGEAWLRGETPPAWAVEADPE